MAIVKAKANIPVRGTIKYADKVEGQYGPQLKLKGEFTTQDGETGDLLFLPFKVADELCVLDVLKPKSDTEFTVLNHHPVTFARPEKGPYEISVNGQAKAEKSPAKSVSPAPVRGAAAPSTGTGERGASPGDAWDVMERVYGKCAAIARDAWGENFDAQALVSATAALFIEANKRGISTAEQIRAGFDGDPGPQFPPD